MNYRYHIMLGDQFVLMRWPSEGVHPKILVNALIKKLEEANADEDFSIIADLVPANAPLYNKKNSVLFLEESFKGEQGHLPGFALWDHRGGRFVTANGAGRGLQYR